jgi:hypothetical protein
MERLPAPGTVFRRLRSGAGAAHDQSSTAPGADRLDRQPCRRQGLVLRPDLPAPGRGHRRALPDRAALGVDVRPGPYAGREQDPGPALLRGAARQWLRHLRLAGVRREHGVVHVLHVGHDRPPQGRAVQPPVDGAALPGRGAARCPERVGARRHPPGRADVPRQRLGIAVRRADGRLQARASGTAPRREVAVRTRPACPPCGRGCWRIRKPATCASPR